MYGVGMEGPRYDYVLKNAKRGPIIDRIGWLAFWTVLWIGLAWSNGVAFLFFRGATAYYVGSVGSLLVMFAIFMLLKWRQDRLS